MTADEVKTLKPIPWIEKYGLKQLRAAHIFYKRKGTYATCLCSECGAVYELRMKSTGDPFEDMSVDIEKPERDADTRCRVCEIKATYKPAGVFKSEYYFDHVVTGKKVSDTEFLFRVFYISKKICKNQRMSFSCHEIKRIYLQKGKKPVRFSPSYYDNGKWYQGECGDTYSYKVHPSAFREIAKCGMFKYVPRCETVEIQYHGQSWVIDYYIAAARYPDMEMIVKLGMDYLANNLVRKYAINFNPRGKTIENRLRINKERLKDLIKSRGLSTDLKLFQLEKKLNQHWSDEELRMANFLYKSDYHVPEKLELAIKYTGFKKLENYFRKKAIFYDEEIDKYNAARKRDEYFDYLKLRIKLGYDMSNEIYLFPNDIHRRHNEMVLESEKEKISARQKEVLEKFPNIRKKYRTLAQKYSAAAAGYVIRPAKDAAEIVEEGRLLHHCVGGDGYLSKHNKGQTYILLLRSASEPEVPFITVEIHDDHIIQWYGAYDEKPEEAFFDGWLNEYTEELKKRKTLKRKSA